MADRTDPGISSGAKVGIAIAVAFGIVCVFSLGLWQWWRRRQRRQMAKDMVNFVDGDIVNLVDGGRFEKPSKPTGLYDSYHGSSSHSTTPSPVYYQPPVCYTTPQVDSYTEYHARAAASGSASAPSIAPSRDIPPSRDMAPPSEPAQSIPPPPAVTTVDNTGNAWSNAGRHPWSPPDYDAHLPMSATSMQADHHFNAIPSQDRHARIDDNIGPHTVAALPAILPEARAEPQAELPAREGHHGWGFEQELDAPQQPPPRRQAPPQGNEFEEQKFLLADVMLLRQQKSTATGGPAG